MRKAIRRRVALDLSWKLRLKLCRLLRYFGGAKSAYAAERLYCLRQRIARLDAYAASLEGRAA